MESLLYVASGGLYKLYDDITDNDIAMSSLHLEILKVFVTMTTSIVMFKNPDVAIFFSLMSILCYFCNQFDTDFWKAWSITPFIITLLHIPYFLNLTSWDISIRILFIAIILIVNYLEAKMFPEEMSVRKYISRITLVISSAVLAYLAYIYEFHYLVPTLLFFVGYHTSNVIFHFNTVFNNTDNPETNTIKKK
jgi:hypothetical protein